MIALGPYTYMFHLLAYALPVVAVQLVVLRLAYKEAFGVALKSVWPPALWVTLWLVIADHLAISAGVWMFDHARLVGVSIGAVPVEEALFFLLTNVLVANGVALFSARRLGRVL